MLVTITCVDVHKCALCRCAVMFINFTCSNRTEERLPDIMWCRDPFMEALKEIEDIN